MPIQAQYIVSILFSTVYALFKSAILPCRRSSMQIGRHHQQSDSVTEQVTVSSFAWRDARPRGSDAVRSRGSDAEIPACRDAWRGCGPSDDRGGRKSEVPPSQTPWWTDPGRSWPWLREGRSRLSLVGREIGRPASAWSLPRDERRPWRSGRPTSATKLSSSNSSEPLWWPWRSCCWTTTYSTSLHPNTAERGCSHRAYFWESLFTIKMVVNNKKKEKL